MVLTFPIKGHAIFADLLGEKVRFEISFSMCFIQCLITFSILFIATTCSIMLLSSLMKGFFCMSRNATS